MQPAQHSVYLLQEVPRREAGWHTELSEGWTTLSHRNDDVWRGTGLLFQESSWKIMRRLATERGIWVRLRHTLFANEFWIGSIHLDPGCTQAQHRADLEQHMHKLRATTLPIIVGCDVNSPLRWAQDDSGDVQMVGRDGKTTGFADVVLGRGLSIAAPRPGQMATPTSKPRQAGRAGRHIDCICYKGTAVSGVHIVEGSHLCLGTDHEMLNVEVKIRAMKHRTIHPTRPRVWTQGPTQITHIDQSTLRKLARTCTRPKPGRSYKDPPQVRTAVAIAKRTHLASDWKAVHKARRQARKAWEQARIDEAAQGDWEQARKIRAKRNTGWDMHFAEVQGNEDPHEVVHEHLQNIYKTGSTLPELPEWTGEVRAFTTEELDSALASGHGGKAVGEDGTSLELLKGICGIEGGRTHLLEFYNQILCTGEIPEDWNRAIMIVIPKVTYPETPSDLRPLAMGSAASKVFARMLLTRTEQHIALTGPEQCSGKWRQACDFVFSIARVMQLEQEWRVGACWLKIDLAKAFDKVDRVALTSRLLQRMGMCAEYRCWYRLLQKTDAILQTGWDSSILHMQGGIKQGAVESPAFFSFLAECCLHETASRYRWSEQANTFDGLNLDSVLYMDDGVQWSKGVQGLERRIAQWATVLQEYGLAINPKKCQLYCSPFYTGERRIRIQGVEVKAADELHVLGLTFKVGITPSEMLAPLIIKTKSKFWGGLRHMLRAKTPLKGRMQLMERILGGTVLWPLAALPMDASSLGLINSLQLQLTVWIMRLCKRATESWIEFRERAYRGARSIVHRYSHKRWSTLWLERWWAYAGHRTRAHLHTTQTAATVIDAFRTRVWWIQQQRQPKTGMRHPGHIFPKLMNLERDMDEVTSGPWRERAYDRDGWRALTAEWVKRKDPPWASMRQASIEG